MMWQGFFDPHVLLKKLGLTEQCNSVLEFGCGYGTFTIPAARIVQRTVYALDIDPEMLAATRSKSESAKLSNIELRQRDFTVEGSGLPDRSVDYVMLFNILHAEERMMMLKESWRVLTPDGILAVIHWNYDSNTPRGPSMSIRPRPEECCFWAEQAGFVVLPPGQTELPPYHYGFVFQRPA